MRGLIRSAVFACTAVALAVAGCAAQPATSGAEPSGDGAVTIDTTPTPTRAGTVLATIKTSQGHTFVFGRSVRGDLVVAENAPVGEAPLLTEDVRRGSIADVFSRLSGGAPVPEALAAAAAAKPAVPLRVSAPPPKAKESQADFIIIPQLTSTQQWFKNSFCAPTLSYMTVCDVTPYAGAINTSQSQYLYDSNYYSYGLNDPSNTGTAAMLEYVWNGSSWQFDWISGTINPGSYWYEYWWNSGPVYRSTALSIDGLGGMTMGGITPGGLKASYDSNAWVFNFNVGGPAFKTLWPNDSGIDCYVGGSTQYFSGYVWVNKPGNSTDLSGMNNSVGSSAVCNSYAPCEDVSCSGATWNAYCEGSTTHQQAWTTVTTNAWTPVNCCASFGGGHQGC